MSSCTTLERRHKLHTAARPVRRRRRRRAGRRHPGGGGPAAMAFRDGGYIGIDKTVARVLVAAARANAEVQIYNNRSWLPEMHPAAASHGAQTAASRTTENDRSDATPDPIHSHSGQNRMDDAQIDESYPGLGHPLTWTLRGRQTERAARARTSIDLGVLPRRHEADPLGADGPPCSPSYTAASRSNVNVKTSDLGRQDASKYSTRPGSSSEALGEVRARHQESSRVTRRDCHQRHGRPAARKRRAPVRPLPPAARQWWTSRCGENHRDLRPCRSAATLEGGFALQQDRVTSARRCDRALARVRGSGLATRVIPALLGTRWWDVEEQSLIGTSAWRRTAPERAADFLARHGLPAELEGDLLRRSWRRTAADHAMVAKYQHQPVSSQGPAAHPAPSRPQYVSSSPTSHRRAPHARAS